MNLTDYGVIEVLVEESDLVTYQPNPSYPLPRYYQLPRSVRFGFGVSF